MSELRLVKMTIDNFKGVKHFEVEFAPVLTQINGGNGCGKTTIADAFTWCLFGKSARGDASGSDNFREKPLDSAGREIHNLITSVTLECVLNDKPYTIMRMQTEKWAREKGSATQKLQGNTTTYFINGVELKLREFNIEISRICADDVFRYVATLSAFNATEWKKRRSILLSMTDDESVNVLLNLPKYSALKDELYSKGLSLEALCKANKDEVRKLKSELDSYPIRMDEAKKSVTAHSEQEISDVKYAIEDAQKDIELINGYIADARTNVCEDKRKALIAQRDALVKQIETEYESATKAALAEYENAERQSSVYNTQLELRKGQREICADRLKSATESRDALRKQFCDVRDTALTVSTNCPTCGQTLPNDTLEKAKATLEADKQSKLAEIRANGITASGLVDEAKKRLDEAEGKLSECEKELVKAKEASALAHKKYCEVCSNPPDSNTPELRSLNAQISECTAVGVDGQPSKIEGYKRRIAELEARIQMNRTIIIEHDIAKNAQTRIDNLKAEMNETGIRLSEAEGISMLIEEFVTERCSMLESNIDSRFNGIHWKLFDTALNGSVNECCVCMIMCDGKMVAYESANTASQINADIEIVRALANYYNVKLPLFVDNAERVVKLADAGTQTITLTVSNTNTLEVIGIA